MTALQFLADSTANDAIREKLREFPNRVYFPNFGKGDNIFKEGIDIDRVLLQCQARISRYIGMVF